MAGISSVKSLKVQPLNLYVCDDNIADGKIIVSCPQAEITGKATVSEHCPIQEISCTVKILPYFFFIDIIE